MSLSLQKPASPSCRVPPPADFVSVAGLHRALPGAASSCTERVRAVAETQGRAEKTGIALSNEEEPPPQYAGGHLGGGGRLKGNGGQLRWKPWVCTGPERTGLRRWRPGAERGRPAGAVVLACHLLAGSRNCGPVWAGPEDSVLGGPCELATAVNRPWSCLLLKHT